MNRAAPKMQAKNARAVAGPRSTECEPDDDESESRPAAKRVEASMRKPRTTGRSKPRGR